MEIKGLKIVKVVLMIAGLAITGAGSIIGDKINKHENAKELAKLVEKTTKKD